MIRVLRYIDTRRRGEALQVQHLQLLSAQNDDTVLALNISMVGPVSNRVLAPRGS